MPYDFVRNTPYSFDFTALYKTLKNDSFWKKHLEHAEMWVNTLKRLDFNSPNNTNCLSIPKNNKEFFRQPFNVNGQDYFMYFNIAEILYSVKIEKIVPIDMISTYFGLDQNLVRYCEEPWSEYDLNNNMPILICEMPTPYSTLVVIDGNHRVSAKMAKRANSILTIAYNPTQQNHFYSMVDWAYYLFALECFHFPLEAQNGECIDNLLSTSCVYTIFKNV